MNRELQAALAALLKPAGEVMKEKLTEVDKSPLGHVLMQVARAHIHGELETEEDLRDVVHKATRPRNP